MAIRQGRARKTNSQPHEASPMASCAVRFPEILGRAKQSLAGARRQYFQRVMNTACSGASKSLNHDVLLTSTYNHSHIIGSMNHVRCSRYLVTHEGSFEYQSHKDGRNMSLDGNFSRSMARCLQRKGQGPRTPTGIYWKRKGLAMPRHDLHPHQHQCEEHARCKGRRGKALKICRRVAR